MNRYHEMNADERQAWAEEQAQAEWDALDVAQMLADEDHQRLGENDEMV
jgi:hypothetical protein